MDPHSIFCPNPDCPASGQVGQGNIRIHSHKEQRYRCTVCGKTFSARRGTPFYRRKVPEETISRIILLAQYGCPIAALAVAFGYQTRTILNWLRAAGEHAEKIHQHLVLQERPLLHVQADEIRIRLQGLIVWLAMAIALPSRLWLGGVVRTRRDKHLIRALAQIVRQALRPGPILLAVDGFSAYVDAFLRIFRSPLHTGKPGRPRLVPWKGIVFGQVIKRYAQRRVVEVQRRLIRGGRRRLRRLLRASKGGRTLNTAYIERLNATFRSRLAALARRTRHLLRRPQQLHALVYLMGTIYNFCTPHQSLTLEDGTPRTPAMAAGITDHVWSVEELLHYQVPPPRRPSPKGRRTRRTPSKAVQARPRSLCHVHG